jgi:hypothetical protein
MGSIERGREFLKSFATCWFYFSREKTERKRFLFSFLLSLELAEGEQKSDAEKLFLVFSSFLLI